MDSCLFLATIPWRLYPVQALLYFFLRLISDEVFSEVLPFLLPGNKKDSQNLEQINENIIFNFFSNYLSCFSG
jgi:hypothetical protein